MEVNDAENCLEIFEMISKKSRNNVHKIGLNAKILPSVLYNIKNQSAINAEGIGDDVGWAGETTGKFFS